MRAMVFLLALPLAACQATAPTPLSSGPSAPAVIQQNGSTTDIRLSSDNGPVSDMVPGAVSHVWPALVAAYQSFGFPVQQIDGMSHVIGAANVRLPHRLAGERLSTYFDCGMDMTGAIADSHVIEMTIQVAAAQQSADSTVVAAKVSAAAYATQGTSTDPVRCSTRGELERRIVEAVRKKVAATP